MANLPAAVKIPLPPYFCGALDENVFDWGHQMEEYFALAGVDDELLKVRLGINRLAKDAAKFWRNFKRDTPEANLPTTWALLGEVLTANFQPINASKAARDAMRNLKQGNRPLREYLHIFRNLAFDIVPNMANEEKLDRFLAGLKPTLRREIEKTNPPVATFIEAAAIAERLDATDRRLRTSTPPETFKTPSHDGAVDNSGYGDYYSDGAAPMDVDATTFATISKLTPDEREHCRKEGPCFRCRKPGHRATDCLSFKTNKRA